MISRLEGKITFFALSHCGVKSFGSSKGPLTPPSPDSFELIEKYHVLGNRYQTCVDERIDCREELRGCQVFLIQ